MHASLNLFSILRSMCMAARLCGLVDHYPVVPDAKVHGRTLPVDAFDLPRSLFGAVQADMKTFDLAQLAFCLGFGDSGDQVVADLGNEVSTVGRTMSWLHCGRRLQRCQQRKAECPPAIGGTSGAPTCYCRTIIEATRLASLEMLVAA
ncbi:hypothetical protein ADL00_34095 [Streptomyces sp. AS58]|uniref:hypothetical protein n=1 Tax=Streptomyces sp. AS58 TaxID=1519489 RepID=UPI0006ADD314|nr:hypothetical protein [Streptomyces sp. AS58]KOV53501.1 hypothetical protein ADL00_34095 [Streptomyces sp. AS58]